MTIVSDNLKRVLRVTKSPNPDAVDGNGEAWKNCDFCSNRREVCTKDTDWEPCPRCSTRPLAPVPTKPKECRCDEPAVQFPNFHHIWCSGGGKPQECKTCVRLWVKYPYALSTDSMPHDVGEPCDEQPTWDTSKGETVLIDEPSGVPGQLPNCLQTADRITSQDRNEAYGHPLDDFECTAAIWTAILIRAGVLKPDAKITAEQAQLMMVGVKISREAGHHKPDNLIDGPGYFRTIEMTIQERERRALAALEELTRLGQEQGGYE